MKVMKKQLLLATLLMATSALSTPRASAQTNTPPATPADMEAFYTSVIEKRTGDILAPLAIKDSAKSNEVFEIITRQYRIMRARDVLIDAQLEAEGKEDNYANRAGQLEAQSKPLHEYFFAQLSKLLTPEQVEMVKDKMTYNKVKVTYDAYNNIIPGLTEADKAKIVELLKEAREKAVDGGSASEKSAIFQVYKDQINDYLNAHGHDVAKAYKDWEDKQALAKKSDGPNTNPP
ncbi:MAG TPA: DUF3826 domain-containing protein [Candidatus Polarisedimenticolia bacterium]|nr:DUF3826 domain-containing protein [Candidatus Polarisedimenticolia bacterium]